MTMFLMQALLWLLAAFLLGYVIGRFLKSLFCRERGEASAHLASPPPPRVDAGKIDARVSGVSATTAGILGGAAAAGAVAVARHKLEDAEPPPVPLKSPKLDVEPPTVHVRAPEVEIPDVDVEAPEEGIGLLDVAKGAVVAAGTGLAAKAASALDFSDTDPHAPNIEPSAPDIGLPEASMTAPTVDAELPDVGVTTPEVDLPDVETTTPEVTLPEVEMTAPEADLPDVEVAAPEADLPDVEVTEPEVTLPDVDVAAPEIPEVVAELPEAIPEAVSATAISDDAQDVPAHTEATAETVPDGMAIDTVTIDTEDGEEDKTNWLLILVQRIREEYQGHSPHAVSRLWNADSGYDCSALEQDESLTLQPAHYDKLGTSHCGVPHAGFVAVGGDVSSIEPGCAVLFHYPNIVVCRDHEDNHHFIRVVS